MKKERDAMTKLKKLNINKVDADNEFTKTEKQLDLK